MHTSRKQSCFKLDLVCEMNINLISVERLHKLYKAWFFTLPDDNDVIDIAAIEADILVKVSILIWEDGVALPLAQEQIRIGWCTWTTHGGAPELVVMAAVENKRVVGQYEM